MLLQACTAAAATAHALAHVLHLTSAGRRMRRWSTRIQHQDSSEAVNALKAVTIDGKSPRHVLLEPDECTSEADGRLVARLSSDDPRTEHLRSHIKAESGKLLRAGN